MITLYIIGAALGIIFATITYFIRKSDDYQPGDPFAIFLITMLFPPLVLAAIVLGTNMIIDNVATTKTVKTPSQYTQQEYYIDNSNQIYIKSQGLTQKVETSSSNIVYSDTAAQPSIKFESTKTLTDEMSTWIPFGYKSIKETHISKIILPKSALTEKLTKVDVVNSANTSDLSLSD